VRKWLRGQARQIVRFVNDPNRVMLRLPDQFGFVFLGFPILIIASLLGGPLAIMLWVAGGAYMIIALAFPFCVMVRADAHRNARLYDSQTKYLLPPEYRNTTSELKGRRH
jgi:hypothetical protein